MSRRAAEAGRTAFPRSSSLALALALVCVLLLAWIVFMVPEWFRNPDLSHGLVSPLLMAILLREARTQTYAGYLSSGANAIALVTLLAASLAIFLFAGLMAAALSWSNDLTLFLIGAALSLLLIAIWVVCARDEWRVLPFAWPAFVACLVPFLSSPFPPGTYSRLTLALQLAVTRGVIGALHVLGIPARQSGNIIELAGARVGIEDACSGIRSLISCVVAALFFSGTLVSRPLARIVLVLVSVPLALGMNFIRSLGLTLAAERGVDIGGAIHTLSGYAGLLVCAFLLALIARGLGRRPPLSCPNVSAGNPPSTALPRVLLAGTALAAVSLLFFVLKMQPAATTRQPAPDLATILPSAYPGWKVETTEDLYRFSSTLQTNNLAQRTYLRETASGIERLTIYLAYWAPHQASVSLVASHTPDACWPGAGWKSLEERASRAPVSVGSHALPSAEYRTFQQGATVQHVWFWHLHDGQPVTDTDPFSPLKLARLILRHGVQSESSQLFIRFSSNAAWPALAAEPLVADIVHRLRPYGL